MVLYYYMQCIKETSSFLSWKLQRIFSKDDEMDAVIHLYAYILPIFINLLLYKLMEYEIIE